MNCITNIAMANARNYITPSDVEEALKKFDVNKVRLHVLEVLGKHSGYGAEDAGLCAFVAWEGKIEEEK